MKSPHHPNWSSLNLNIKHATTMQFGLHTACAWHKHPPLRATTQMPMQGLNDHKISDLLQTPPFIWLTTWLHVKTTALLVKLVPQMLSEGPAIQLLAFRAKRRESGFLDGEGLPENP